MRQVIAMAQNGGDFGCSLARVLQQPMRVRTGNWQQFDTHLSRLLYYHKVLSIGPAHGFNPSFVPQELAQLAASSIVQLD